MSSQRIIETFCDVDIEQTAESFHAYAVPEMIEINPGDQVVVHDVPTDIGFGQRVVRRCRATVYRASRLQQFWTKLAAIGEFTELYEVGFSSRRRP